MLYQCPNCSSGFTQGTRFCQNCGHNLEAGLQSSDILDSFYTSGGYPKASLGNRFLAALLDGLITIGLSIPAIIFFSLAMYKTEGYDEDNAAGLFFFAFLCYLFPLGYNFIKDGLAGGQSWGKRAVGLMVVNLDTNSPCDKGKSFYRNFISAIVSIIPFIGWLIEPIMVLADNSGRKLGDKAARTQVIEKLNYR